VASWDRFLSATLDALLGLLIALLLLLAMRYTNIASYSVTIQQGSLRILQTYIAWLERFPAGFKLNVELTHNMGHELRNLIGMHQQLLESTLWNVEYCQTWGIPILAFVAATFGWTTFLAVVVDLWRLQIIYAIVLAFSFRNLYKAELYLLSALWRLFRGKKRNVLRQRTDSMQYDAMQLLVGTIGFCICIFLWTTILVYYTFFMVWNVLMHLPLLLLWVAYIFSRAIPLGRLWWRIFRPNWFAKNVHVQTLKEDDDDDHGGGDVLVTRLCTIAESPASILGSSCLVSVVDQLLFGGFDSAQLQRVAVFYALCVASETGVYG
jgi:phosphatidylinositol glycan class Q protein